MATPTMKAVRVHSYGGSEVLTYEDIERPTPGAGEILVRNYATSINPVDLSIRAGYLDGVMQYSMPLTPGWDVAGTIEALGSGVSGFEVGEGVYGMIPMRGGTYAEYVVTRPAEIARKPASADWNSTAATPVVALTAWQVLFDVAQLTSGQKVLIHGAAGGVGSFAVQLARHAGAYVIGTASVRNHDLVRQLGANEVIDYKATAFEQVVQGVDVVVDTVGGETRERSWQVLKQGGILVTIIPQPLSAEQAAAHGVRAELVRVQPNPTQLTQIAQLIEAGKVNPVVEKVLPLSEARQAHDLTESGHGPGKVVLQIAEY